MSAYTDTLPAIRWPDAPKSSYDVVIVGGGGHGLSTAYYLATRHGITNVAVVEADYIASGNTGRNTTIIRANYGIPEAIRFYQHSLEMYQALEDETGAEILHQTKGIFWVAHTEMAMRTERARALMNTACGAKTFMVTPAELKELVPQVDLTGGGRYPVLGASHHVEAATARHDRVAWAFAAGASQRGVDVLQHTPVTGLLRDGDRVVGVETPNGPIAAGRRPLGGRWPGHADGGPRRRPPADPDASAPRVRDQRLRAGLRARSSPARSSSCYVSQTERGQMLIGAEFDSQPSYSRQSSFAALRSYSYKITRLLPFLRDLRILRTWAGICDISADYSPIMGATGVDGFLVTTGWGTWGFKAIPAGGEGMAELIATGRPSGADRAVRARPLPPRPRPGRPGLGGDALMLWLDCPRCGRRPLDEFTFGGERRPTPDSITDPDERDFDEVWVFENPDGVTTERWFHSAGCRRWLTVRRDTSDRRRGRGRLMGDTRRSIDSR